MTEKSRQKVKKRLFEETVAPDDDSEIEFKNDKKKPDKVSKITRRSKNNQETNDPENIQEPVPMTSGLDNEQNLPV